MKILVTGSAGRIGKCLVGLLGEHELMLVDKKTGFDLSKEAMNPILEFSPEIIFHLAASFERTDETAQFLGINYHDNMQASLRLNQAIAKMRELKKVVFASSYLVYSPDLYMYKTWEMPSKFGLSENQVTEARNLCGAAKLYEESELNFIQRNIHKDMKLVHARIFRVYGENGQEFVSRCAEWKKMGMPVDLWKPENSFDYVHFQDVAEGLVHLAFSDANGVYNVGSGESHSIQEVVDAIGCKTRQVEAPDGELYENSCADITKIIESGWKPKISFKTGIERVLNQ